MSPTYKKFQSCGMPFKRDPTGAGSNVDGSRSAMYCSHCYVQGRFTRPDITAAEICRSRSLLGPISVATSWMQNWIPD